MNTEMELNISKTTDKDVTAELLGSVNSANAPEFENDMETIVKDHPGKNLIMDLKKCDLITSAGMRVFLKLLKRHIEIRVINTSDKMYEVFEMTGFTELMQVDRPIKKSELLEDAVVIGHGANSTVYKTGNDTVVKVLRDGYDDESIRQELNKTRRAFIMGIPTIIPYTVVEINGKLGVAFELVEASTLAELIAGDNSNLDKYLDDYVSSVKQFHDIEVCDDDKKIFTDAAAQIIRYRNDLNGHADPDVLEKTDKIIAEFSVGNSAIHGDAQPNNVMVTDDTMLYIDMDTLAYGNPEYDLVYLYNALVNFQYIEPMDRFFGFSNEVAQKLWDRFIRKYFNTEDEEFINEKEKTYKVLGLCRLYRWALKRKSDKPEVIATLKQAFEDAVRHY